MIKLLATWCDSCGQDTDTNEGLCAICEAAKTTAPVISMVKVNGRAVTEIKPGATVIYGDLVETGEVVDIADSEGAQENDSEKGQ